MNRRDLFKRLGRLAGGAAAVAVVGVPAPVAPPLLTMAAAREAESIDEAAAFGEFVLTPYLPAYVAIPNRLLAEVMTGDILADLIAAGDSIAFEWAVKM